MTTKNEQTNNDSTEAKDAAGGGFSQPAGSTYFPADHTQQLAEIAALVMDDAPKDICLTVDAVRWVRDRYRDGQKALRELEKIRTEKILCRTCGADEANAVSAARHILSNAERREG